jgi:hypothetical protein
MTVKISKPAVNLREELADLKKPTGIAGEAMLRAETPQEQQALIGVGRRNMLYNGAMVISQRGTSETFTTAGQEYVLDRFYKVNGSSYAPNITMSQQADAPSGFTYSLKVNVDAVTTPASNQNLLIGQSLEGYDVAQLGYGTADAKSITLSFWVKANQTGSRGVYIMTQDANREYLAEYTINNSATWEYKTVTIPPNTIGGPNIDNTTGILVLWPLSTGSGDKIDASTGWEQNGAYRGLSGEPDLCNTVGNYFQITGVQLELGKVATPFEHRSYGEELALCQRYYQKIGAVARVSFGTAVAHTSGTVFCPVRFMTTMRTTPSQSHNGSENFYVTGSNQNQSPPSGQTFGTEGININGVTLSVPCSVTVGNGYWFNTKADAVGYIAWDAEL